MPWSIFTQGGGSGAAATWAQDLLGSASQEWGVNVDTPGNEQVIYDWEVSEGGGGQYNPLNQGPVPNHPELTTTGSQYGGGAADFASIPAGIQGAIDYLDMPNFAGIKAALEQNNPAAARQAIIASPWAASHYNGGSSFSSSPLPGQANAITGSSTSPATLTGFSIPGLGGISSGITSDIKTAAGYVLAIGGGVALVVLGVFKTANPGKSVSQTVSQAAPLAALAA